MALDGNVIHLTRREWQVLDGRRRGLAVKQVAAELGLSCHTVHTHITSILRKTGSQSILEALWSITPAACRNCCRLQD